jgi:hypothetical protein
MVSTCPIRVDIKNTGRHGQTQPWSVLLKSIPLLALLLAVLPARLSAEDFEIIKTGAYTVYYEPDVKLKRVYGKLRKRSIHMRERAGRRSLTSIEEKITHRLDLILQRVKETLDMRPPNVAFTIKIFKDRDDVYDNYTRLTRKHDKVKSFYHHESGTIFVSEKYISDSILAHEFAHVLVRHYFVVRPPSKVSEMMAIHVDTLLDQK